MGTMSFLFLASFLFVTHGDFAKVDKSIYIIHMDMSFMPKAFASHHHWYTSMIDSISITGAGLHFQPKLVHSYSNAFHGFSALLSKDELEDIKKLPGFVSAYNDREVVMHTTHSTDFLKLNTVSGLWPASQFGKDVIIGVIDSGIWPESPSFKDDGMTPIPSKWKGTCQEGQQFNSSMCNLKLIGARYFNAGLRATYPDRGISMNSARDTYGHGTHVAGIAAGNYVEGVSFFGYAPGTARGAAPRARLAAYKALWDEGSVASDVLAAMDQAVADGVDIISMSLGYDRIPLYDDPIAIATFGAMAKGVLVSCSAGNRGPDFSRVNNDFPWSLTVASGLIDRWFVGTLTLGNGLTIIGWSMFPARASVTNLNLIYDKNISACNSTMTIPDSFSAIVICEQDKYEVFTFSDQIRYVSESKPRAAVFISNEPLIFRSHEFPHPGVVISPKDGAKVIKYALKGKNPTATITFQETLLGTKPAPTVAASSSRGPSRSYPGIMKPDIMAPGVLIFAPMVPNTDEVQLGQNVYLSTDYTLMSGTSMACPHASGIAALLKAAHPDWSPSAIRSAMMTTASTIDNTGSEIKDQEDFKVAGPLDFGAGFVDPNRALDPGLLYDATPQDYVNLVCSMNFTRKQTQAITRLAKYNCKNPSSDLNYPSFIALYEQEKGHKLVRNFTRTVTNVGNGPTTYKAKLVAPKGTTIRISTETLKFSRKNEKQSYSLTISYRSRENFHITHGSLTWIEDNGKHSVRSAIVIFPMPEPL